MGYTQYLFHCILASQVACLGNKFRTFFLAPTPINSVLKNLREKENPPTKYTYFTFLIERLREPSISFFSFFFGRRNNKRKNRMGGGEGVNCSRKILTNWMSKRWWRGSEHGRGGEVKSRSRWTRTVNSYELRVWWDCGEEERGIPTRVSGYPMCWGYRRDRGEWIECGGGGEEGLRSD